MISINLKTGIILILLCIIGLVCVLAYNEHDMRIQSEEYEKIKANIFFEVGYRAAQKGDSIDNFEYYWDGFNELQRMAQEIAWKEANGYYEQDFAKTEVIGG